VKGRGRKGNGDFKQDPYLISVCSCFGKGSFFFFYKYFILLHI
jgi:hypothetical protein